jgi:hypothetical protein
MIAFILETFRRDNLILIMTTPNMEFIDKKVRSLLHGYAETIDPTFTGGKFGWIKYFHIVVNLREGKIMFQYPRIKTPTGKIDILRGKSFLDGNVKFGKPPDWIAKDYEKKKLQFTENLKDLALDALSALDADGKKKDKFDLRDIIEIINDNPKKYGLVTDEEIMQSDVIDRTYVVMTLENPGIRISKTDIGSAIKYLVYLHGGQFKWTKGKSLTDEDMSSVANLMRIHKKQTLVAKAINTSDTTLAKKIKEWKDRNIWPDDLMAKGKDGYTKQKNTKEESEGTDDDN